METISGWPSSQRYPEQEPQPGQYAVTGANAQARLCKMQLEAADILKGCRIGGSLEKRGESLAAEDVTSLCSRAQLARAR